jgi:protein TonB
MELKMASMYYVKKGPNRLLQVLIIVSLGIHMLVFMYVTGLYRPKLLQFIELTLQDEKKPLIRGIPRPPQLSKEDDKPKKLKETQVTPIQLPDVNQLRLGRGDSRISSSLMEGVTRLTKEDYYEMVRLRIDREKKYPQEADGSYKEGRVILSFMINLDGSIRDLKIVKPSPYKDLNEAALQAVMNSVPFSKPPSSLFKDSFMIELNVTFDLI